MRIVYHGTPPRTTAGGTFFVNHLEDAVGYGGPYVFEVVVSRGFFNTTTGRDRGEATNSNIVPPTRILVLTRRGC